jgi:hypothetical protein
VRYEEGGPPGATAHRARVAFLMAWRDYACPSESPWEAFDLSKCSDPTSVSTPQAAID